MLFGKTKPTLLEKLDFGGILQAYTTLLVGGLNFLFLHNYNVAKIPIRYP